INFPFVANIDEDAAFDLSTYVPRAAWNPTNWLIEHDDRGRWETPTVTFPRIIEVHVLQCLDFGFVCAEQNFVAKLRTNMLVDSMRFLCLRDRVCARASVVVR
ncbi:MAG TPA: hypothetical protein VK530_14835, partial [Candidatus Acidoferrum sp.]|nr:hypothetical protein [Candidatus Acidoferrum sp.]